MAEYKAKVMLSDKVYRMIKWFTFNFDKEIAGLGTVKIKTDENKEKYFYVEDLLFPKQKVTGATVQFTPEMWGDLIKEHGLEGLKDIAFHWHRHPKGCVHHSGTDEQETFETFMSKEANRPYFIFYITSEGNNGDMEEDARVEIRKPIRASILRDDVDIWVEETPEDTKLRKECEGIIEKCIVKEQPRTYPSINDYPRHQTFPANNTMASVQKKGWSALTAEIISDRLGIVAEGNKVFENHTVGGLDIKKEDILGMNFHNGGALVLAGETFHKIIQELLDTKNGSKQILPFINKWSMDRTEKGNYKYKFQPKDYYGLLESLLQLYIDYNRLVFKKYISKVEDRMAEQEFRMVDEENIPTTTPVTIPDSVIAGGYGEDEELSEEYEYTDNDSMDYMQEFIRYVEGYAGVEWEDPTYAVIYDMTYDKVLGDIIVDKDTGNVTISGKRMVPIIKSICNRRNSEKGEKLDGIVAAETAREKEREKALTDKTGGKNGKSKSK